MLQKYEIISLNKGTTDIKRILEQNNFIENEDYLLRNVAQQFLSGIKYKNEYFLHPESFKICLMRSQKTRKYAKYYLLLEECIKYFNDYQIELNKKYIIKLKNKIVEKDDKIDHLENKLNTIIKNNEDLIKQNNKILKNNEDLLLKSKKSEKNDRKMKQLNKKMLIFLFNYYFKIKKLKIFYFNETTIRRYYY